MKLLLDRKKEYGVVLDGGGARGAYQIGAWKALKEAGIRIHAVAGTSNCCVGSCEELRCIFLSAPDTSCWSLHGLHQR